MVLDWSFDVALENQLFVSSSRYDAMNRIIEQTNPSNTTTRYFFNEANLLEKVDANLRGEQTGAQPV
jgi:YD repeat-containing protein